MQGQPSTTQAREQLQDPLVVVGSSHEAGDAPRFYAGRGPSRSAAGYHGARSIRSARE